MLDNVLQRLAADKQAAVDRTCALLSIPSVSTDPAYKADVADAARWVANALIDCGLDTTVHPTDGHPIVLANTSDANLPAHAPHVLFYGHYDVQPPDPVDLWTTNPFEPTVRHGAIYARGASDDKGQVCCFIEALRAWHQAAGGPPVRVTALIEGEEECGSAHLLPFIKAHKDELNADIVVISDTCMWNAHTPAITYGLRGLLYYDVQLHAFDRDLHSGMYGGTIANPATLLTQVIGKLFDEKHRVTVPGFYDDVMPLSDEERARWADLSFDEKEYLAGIGAAQGFGEAGFETLERKWARPACDVNGLYGGYGGEGAKTVIPSFAGAKVSFRLAANQNPTKIAAAFERWIHSHDVHGCTWKLTNHGGCQAVVVSTDSPYMAAAHRAIEKSAGRPPVLVREGATIPVVSDFKTLLGLDSLLIGFGLDNDCVHSPNEKFDLENFELGCRTHAALLAEVAEIHSA